MDGNTLFPLTDLEPHELTPLTPSLLRKEGEAKSLYIN
jgi:hypothetical protein